VSAFLASWRGRLALGGFGLLVLIAALSGHFLNHSAHDLNFLASGQGASAAHPLGTDALGRDVAARTLTATKLSLVLATAAGGIAAVLGVALGGAAALLPRRPRNVAARTIDAFLAFPDLLIAIFVMAIVGVGAGVAIVAVGVANAPFFARVALTLTASVGGKEYLASARLFGVPTHRLLTRHVVPNIAETLLVTTFVGFSYSLIAISSLSFLGLGVQFPQYDWGRLVTIGIADFYENPLEALAPAFLIVVTGLLFTYMGEAMARAMDPRLWAAHRDTVHRRHALRWSRRRRGPFGSSQAEGQAATANSGTYAGTNGDVLDLRELRIEFPGPSGPVEAVAGVSLRVCRGEVVGMVGESGSGKTLTALSIGRLVDLPASVHVGRLDLVGRSLLDERLGRHERRALLKRAVAYVFQDPSASLNPALRLGVQLREAVSDDGGSRAEATARATNSLSAVAMSAPSRRLHQYPHELSGGMRQRATIAMSTLADPALIVADEPTTALDVTVQAQVLRLLRDINGEHETAILLISHSVPVVASICDRVVVMYAGRIVEDGSTVDIVSRPAHPYTQALLAAVPTLEVDRAAPLASIPGAPPAPGEVSRGCPFAPRCPHRMDVCSVDRPELRPVRENHVAACWLVAGERGT
jgi:oligopeptide/dipeptide ABC transporter ATP-binding protein